MNTKLRQVVNDSDVNKYIGSKIRYYRKICDWTQTKLGDEIGVSFQQVQKYEKGVNAVSFQKLIQICNVLNVSLNDVLGDLLKNK
jgi:transcriptional regulator with XRE-family HTH domain